MKFVFCFFALCSSQAVDSIQAIGQIAVDSVTLYQDTAEYFSTGFYILQITKQSSF